MITVCKDCTERTLGCHGTCERYLEQRRELDRSKEELAKARKKAKDLDKYFAERKRR